MGILCYHSINATWNSSLAVIPDAFRAHCRHLSRQRTVPLDTAMRHLDREGRTPRGMHALTFDDGFEDFYTSALPILSDHGLPATVFIVAGTLDGTVPTINWVDGDLPAGLRSIRSDELREVRAAGVAIGSHGLTHDTLTELDEAACLRELTDSRELLEDLLAERVSLLAYPRGRHDERVRRAAEKAGYECAFSLPTGPEVVSRFAVPRAGIYRGDGVAAVRFKAWPSYPSMRRSGAIGPPLRRAALAVGGLRRSREHRHVRNAGG